MTWGPQVAAQPERGVFPEGSAADPLQVVYKCRHGNPINMDLGLASLAVTSDGEKIAPPKFPCSALKRFGRLQRRLSPG